MKGLGTVFLLVFALTEPVVAWAQEEADAERHFRVLAYGDGFFEGISFEKEGFDGGKEWVELEFSPDQKSRSYSVPADESVTVFYREITDEDEESRHLEVGSVRWGNGLERATLIFLEWESEPESQAPYDILVADESPDIWSGGSFRFLNLSGAPLFCEMAEQGLDIAQGLSEVYEFDRSLSGPIRFKLAVQWEGVPQIIYSARILPNQSRPKLYVIKPPLELESLRIRVVNVW